MITITNIRRVVNGRSVVEMACDDSTDVANLPTFAIENRLQQGSECICIDESSVYTMKSDGTWVSL